MINFDIKLVINLQAMQIGPVHHWKCVKLICAKNNMMLAATAYASGFDLGNGPVPVVCSEYIVARRSAWGQSKGMQSAIIWAVAAPNAPGPVEGLTSLVLSLSSCCLLNRGQWQHQRWELAKTAALLLRIHRSPKKPREMDVVELQ